MVEAPVEAVHVKSVNGVRMFRRPDFEGPSIGSMGLSVLKSHFIRTMNALFMLNMFLGLFRGSLICFGLNCARKGFILRR